MVSRVVLATSWGYLQNGLVAWDVEIIASSSQNSVLQVMLCFTSS